MSAGRDLPEVHYVTYDQIGPLLNKSWHLRRHVSLATDSLTHVATPSNVDVGGGAGGQQEYSLQRDLTASRSGCCQV